MKSLVMLLFIVGVVMLTIGYQKELLSKAEVKERVEYRFIPRSIYEEQFGKQDLTRSFRDMFDYEDVYLNTPYL
jgi:hypothetical protein